MLSMSSAAISTKVRLSHKTRMLVSWSWSVLKRGRKSKLTGFFFEALIVPTESHLFSAVFNYFPFGLSLQMKLTVEFGCVSCCEVNG